jgi:Flp pilus assembly protein TadD
LGKALASLGRWQEAAGEYRRTLELRPDSVQGHFRLGEALRSLGDIAGARAQYELTLQLDPRHSEARKNLAELNSATSKILSGTNQPAKSE